MNAVTAIHVQLRDAVRGQQVDNLVLVKATAVEAEDRVILVLYAGHDLNVSMTWTSFWSDEYNCTTQQVHANAADLAHAVHVP